MLQDTTRTTQSHILSLSIWSPLGDPTDLITFDYHLNLTAAVGAPGPRNQINLIVAVQEAVLNLSQNQCGLGPVPSGRRLLYLLRRSASGSLVKAEGEGSFLVRSTTDSCELLILIRWGVIQIENGGLQAWGEENPVRQPSVNIQILFLNKWYNRMWAIWNGLWLHCQNVTEPGTTIAWCWMFTSFKTHGSQNILESLQTITI